ncbi:MAG: (2Fe-2S)-binding protein [Alphaproteobacteria bacterium]|nr:(2Fe-2S)-binding protein [Alphaproteobacteria bacterium]
MTQEGCVTVEEIGAALKAGSSCGSCIPEIRSLIAALDKNLAA